MTQPTEIYSIADRLVDELTNLDPIFITMSGVSGHNGEMSDYSPDGAEALRDLGRSALAALQAAPVTSDRDRIAMETIEEVLERGIGRASQSALDAGDHLRSLNVLRSSLRSIRMAFDLLPRENDDDWQHIASRLVKVPSGLVSYQKALERGMERNIVVARRQVEECIAQVDTWTGRANAGPAYFDRLVDSYDAAPTVRSDALRADLETGVRASSDAYAAIGDFLRDTYAPRVSDEDAVGRDRYARGIRGYNGTNIDLDETYAWGWDQLRWVESEMEITADRGGPPTDWAAMPPPAEGPDLRSLWGDASPIRGPIR
jgi:uncharacterized protein (DUF885 family)